MIIRGESLSAINGPEPVVVDDLPKRRSSVARPGGGSLVGLQAESIKGVYDDDDSTRPASPELLKQTSEMQLLDTAGSLGTVRRKRTDNREVGGGGAVRDF